MLAVSLFLIDCTMFGMDNKPAMDLPWAEKIIKSRETYQVTVPVRGTIRICTEEGIGYGSFAYIKHLNDINIPAREDDLLVAVDASALNFKKNPTDEDTYVPWQKHRPMGLVDQIRVAADREQKEVVARLIPLLGGFSFTPENTHLWNEWEIRRDIIDGCRDRYLKQSDNLLFPPLLPARFFITGDPLRFPHLFNYCNVRLGVENGHELDTIRNNIDTMPAFTFSVIDRNLAAQLQGDVITVETLDLVFSVAKASSKELRGKNIIDKRPSLPGDEERTLSFRSPNILVDQNPKHTHGSAGSSVKKFRDSAIQKNIKSSAFSYVKDRQQSTSVKRITGGGY